MNGVRSKQEQEFHDAMEEIYRQAKKKLKYNAKLFLQMVAEYGGVDTAKRLLVSDAVQYGFTKLWEHGRFDLTVEAHVLKPEFRSVFTHQERAEAKSRLEAYGWQINE